MALWYHSRDVVPSRLNGTVRYVWYRK